MNGLPPGAAAHLLHHLLCEQLAKSPENEDRDHDGNQHAQYGIHLLLGYSSELTPGIFKPVYKLRVIKSRRFILLRLFTFIHKIDCVSLKLNF